MPFRIVITDEAELHLRSLPAHEQRLIESAIRRRLLHEPGRETKAVKQLRPNRLAQYELRVGDFRVMYNVEGVEVVLLVIGRKKGNQLFVKGESYHGHQDDSSGKA